MKIRFILFFLFSIIVLQTTKAQNGNNMSVQQTVDYINMKLSDNIYEYYLGSSHYSHRYSIAIDNDYLKIIDKNEDNSISIYTVNIKDLDIHIRPFYSSITLFCKGTNNECWIHSTPNYGYPQSTCETIEMDQNHIRTKTSESLRNAFEYLLKKLDDQYSANDKQDENDPFATKNLTKTNNQNVLLNSNKLTEASDNDITILSPFIGKTISSVNFRDYPSTSSNVMYEFKQNHQIWVYSTKDINGFYKAIDIETNKTGWVSKQYIKWYGDAKINEKGDFILSGTTTSEKSEVVITNKTEYFISLKVGNETFSLSPNNVETYYISPGSKYYIASAPGLTPTAGIHNFESKSAYTWEFFIENSFR